MRWPWVNRRELEAANVAWHLECQALRKHNAQLIEAFKNQKASRDARHDAAIADMARRLKLAEDRYFQLLEQTQRGAVGQ